MNITLVTRTDCRFILNDKDPKEYGYICGRCSARYGTPQKGNYIDIVRCDTCKANPIKKIIKKL